MATAGAKSPKSYPAEMKILLKTVGIPFLRSLPRRMIILPTSTNYCSRRKSSWNNNNHELCLFLSPLFHNYINLNTSQPTERCVPVLLAQPMLQRAVAAAPLVKKKITSPTPTQLWNLVKSSTNVLWPLTQIPSLETAHTGSSFRWKIKRKFRRFRNTWAACRERTSNTQIHHNGKDMKRLLLTKNPNFNIHNISKWLVEKFFVPFLEHHVNYEF